MNFALVLAVALGAISAWSTPPIEVVRLDSTPSCGALNHEINIDPNDANIQCLRVYFADFAVVSRPNASTDRNCHMRAKLRIPANTQFSASEAVAEGVFKIVGDAFAGMLLSYQMPSLGGSSSWHQLFQSNDQGDFTFTSRMTDEVFTPCLGYDTEVDLVSDLHAFIDQRSGDSSFISLDETGKRLSWNWKIKPCEADLYSRTFITYYSAPNGRRYQAKMIISGNRGTYHSEAGFVGDLFNLRRTNGGRVLEGEWSALGVNGRLKFTMSDARKGTFSGNWTDSQNRKGSWSGYYDEDAEPQ